jgi:hypothetical protein
MSYANQTENGSGCDCREEAIDEVLAYVANGGKTGSAISTPSVAMNPADVPVTAVIDEERAATITPETALEFIESADWLIYGGSGYGHAGKRGRGRILGFIFGRK